MDLEIRASLWAQGAPTTLAAERAAGRGVLLVFFQVNCPGCVFRALPIAQKLHERFSGPDFSVIGISTAFEDFELNTQEGLRALLAEGRVFGDSAEAAAGPEARDEGVVIPGFKLTFPVCVDELEGLEPRHMLEALEREGADPRVIEVLRGDPGSLEGAMKELAKQRSLVPKTFVEFEAKGTPHYYLFDREGRLLLNSLGHLQGLEATIAKIVGKKGG
ncbi:hypothetical protein DFJ74DRAFT_706654 [Hyaloraphidium curvatum]|nr:hypothetical protein DFJ74DRAFT_706654 [Hyaloraphidium curvatum]